MNEGVRLEEDIGECVRVGVWDAFNNRTPDDRCNRKVDKVELVSTIKSLTALWRDEKNPK